MACLHPVRLGVQVWLPMKNLQGLAPRVAILLSIQKAWGPEWQSSSEFVRSWVRSGDPLKNLQAFGVWIGDPLKNVQALGFGGGILFRVWKVLGLQAKVSLK